MATKKKGTGLMMVWADIPADKEKEFDRWYNEEHLAERLSLPGFLSGARYEKVPGVIRGRRFRAVTGTPTYLTFYEFQNPKVSESAAWAAQRDIAPETQRIRPHMRHAPGSPGVYVKTFSL